MRNPTVVACGIGVDSVAMLVGLEQRGERPDLIIFSDAGSERDSTYAYIPKLREWLEAVGFPDLTIVKYVPKRLGDKPAYHTLRDDVLANASLPALAYGGHTCSAKWKLQPQFEYFDQWDLANEAWARGGKVEIMVGFEDSKHERNRSKRCGTFAVQDIKASHYHIRFPLQEWGWDRVRCVGEIARSDLPVPTKSSCTFCPAMKPWEVDELPQDKLVEIIIMETRATPKHVDYANRRRAELERLAAVGDEDAAKKLTKMPAPGLPLTEGLWRKTVKGFRGATPKPGSITAYIRNKGLLSAELVDALAEVTETHHLTDEDFKTRELTSWPDWLRETELKAVAKTVEQSEKQNQ